MNEKVCVLKNIYDLFEARISGQDKTKRRLASFVATHYNILKNNLSNAGITGYVKSHLGSILLYGPSGSGKTEFFRTLRDGLNVPVLILDSTSLSNAGYKGDTLPEIMERYYTEHEETGDGDYGIVVFDEFDKLCDMARVDDKSGAYAKALLNEFLKLMEGKEIAGHDTSHLLMVFVGSFQQLVDSKLKNKENSISEKRMGFHLDAQGSDQQKENTGTEISVLTNKDFVAYGLNRELMGRICLICNVEALSDDYLKQILTDKDNSPLNVYKMMFAGNGNDLKFTTSAIDYIAAEAGKIGLGARGMQQVLTPYMMDVIYHTAGISNMKISVTGVDIKNKRFPVMKPKPVVARKRNIADLIHVNYRKSSS